MSSNIMTVSKDGYLGCQDLAYKLIYETMGNKSAKKEKSVLIEDQEIPMKHPRLQKATYKKSQNREYIQTTIPVANNKDYDTWGKSLNDSPVKESNYALNPIKHSYKKAGMCGNSGTATLQYENHPFLLSDQIKERVRTLNPSKFTEPELWYLLYGLTDVTEKFHRKGEKAGDIRPENIFLSENGSFKIATKHSWPGELSSYEKRLFEDEKTYLSPEEANDIIIGRQTAKGNPEIAESFSVGLTVLHSAILSDGDKLYQNKSKFDTDLLHSDREALRTDPLYSDLFKFVLLSLTDPLPENRVSCEELNSWLRPNEDNILKLQPFGVNILPLKVQRYADSTNIPKRNTNFDPTYTSIGKLESFPDSFGERPVNQQVSQQANSSWADIDQKIRKSRQMFPS